jgi:hypothetical protein
MAFLPGNREAENMLFYWLLDEIQISLQANRLTVTRHVEVGSEP